MLFNSYSFLLLFLPLLLVSWRLAATYAPARLGLVLLLFSVVFYGLWGLPFLVLLAVILGMNYMFAQALNNNGQVVGTGLVDASAIKGWDFASATTLASMFQNDNHLTTVDFSGWDGFGYQSGNGGN